jgi:hypothetical protein
MRNEPKIVLDELVPRLEITAFCETEKPFLLGFWERRRKGMSVGRAEKQTKAFRHDRKKKRQQNYHLLTRYAETSLKIRFSKPKKDMRENRISFFNLLICNDFFGIII